MKLTDLLNGLNVIKISGSIRDDEVSGIEYDSRKVVRDALFVAIKGFKVDGHDFIMDALKAGVVAVVVENDDSVSDETFIHNNAAKILVGDSRKSLADISHIYYNRPSSALNLVGITGTNGKTTTSYILKNVFETAGIKTGMLGTISNYIGNKIIDSNLTTPESNDLNKLLFNMVNENCHNAVMEVSSHALSLKRVHGLSYNSAVFTNITAEHLDFHKTFDNYLSTKKILFDSLSKDAFVVYNADDHNSNKIIANCIANKYSFGTLSNVDFFINEIEYNFSGTSFNLQHKKNEYKIETSLVGEFNAYNACAAFAIGKLNGIDEDIIINGIKTTPQIPGRFEVITNGQKNVVIDYSHTPDSLEKALFTLSKLNSTSREVITVFGCGGNRDSSKRPKMGEIATTLSDKVIITSDNPRDENPDKIINGIISGITKDNYTVIEERADAIEEAIKQSNDDAIVLIAGKGHEDYQEIKGKRLHFSDKEKAEKYLGD